MSRLSSGCKPSMSKQNAMPRLGRDVAGDHVREGISAQLRERRHRGGADKTVEHHWDAQLTRRERRTEDRGEFAPTERAGDPQRVVQHRRMGRECLIDHGALVRETRIINAGAAAGPTYPSATKQRRRDRRRRRGVADPHLAETQKIGLRTHGVIAVASASRNWLSSIAGARVKSAVGVSSAIGITRSAAPAVRAS